MIVWIVQLAYRQDYIVKGVYSTLDLASEACEKYNQSIGDKRYNPSWTATFFSMELQDKE